MISIRAATFDALGVDEQAWWYLQEVTADPSSHHGMWCSKSGLFHHCAISSWKSEVSSILLTEFKETVHTRVFCKPCVSDMILSPIPLASCDATRGLPFHMANCRCRIRALPPQ